MRVASAEFIKAHAYGNDFLFIEERAVAGGQGARWARAACDRHRGVGADGLALYRRTPAGAAMQLFNADGSAAEVSGNGVRCLAAIVAGGRPAGREDADVVIDTAAGARTLRLLEADPPRRTFRAQMGEPAGLERRRLRAAGEEVDAVVLSVGNPQCVVLADAFDDARFERLAPALAAHEAFPDGTNVEFAAVERPGRVRIRIWERGVGPTSASGTGACAAAVAAAAFGGAARAVEVVSPGGSQQVEWTADGIHLTGWAEIVARGVWTAPPRLYSPW